jgi:peroxiredoxin family protein
MMHDDGVERMTIVAWSGDLDKVWPQYILATTGAAYGMEVTMFCTFWGLFTTEAPRGEGHRGQLDDEDARAVNNERLSHLNFGGAGPR